MDGLFYFKRCNNTCNVQKLDKAKMTVIAFPPLHLAKWIWRQLSCLLFHFSNSQNKQDEWFSIRATCHRVKFAQ